MWGFFRRCVLDGCALIRAHKNERKTGLEVPHHPNGGEI